MLEERHVEGRVVDDELRVVDEAQKLRDDVRKSGLVLEELEAQPVHLLRTRVDCALGVQILVKVTAGQAPIDDLDATDLDDPVTAIGFQSRGLGVEDDLPHQRSASIRSMASLAAASTRSFSM